MTERNEQTVNKALAQGLSEAPAEANLNWWSGADSNRRPLACHASALPAELPPR